ncbi:MAG: phytoene/squalene synthase family protein [Parvibaculaceae bacterium]|nr:phytoene/squalene synthase family protein [Parvibaculaceae bacterium]
MPIADALRTDALGICLDQLRRLDHDRYLGVLLAPRESRDALVALHAFNIEIARVREAVSEAMLGEIRLEWWREAVEALAAGQARGHEAALAMDQTGVVKKLGAEPLIALIDARARDLDDEPFTDMAALEAYALGTSSALMKMAAAILGGRANHPSLAPAGIAYALTGLLRALPVHASQGRLYLPLDMLRTYDVDPHTVFSGEMSAGLGLAIRDVASAARRHLAQARETMRPTDRRTMAALLPAALCELYLDQIETPGFDPFRQTTEMPAFRLQLRLLAARWRSRI